MQGTLRTGQNPGKIISHCCTAHPASLPAVKPPAMPLLLALLWLLVLASLVLPRQVQAQAQNEIHWAYSAFLGTGWYQVDGELDVYMLRVPLRWSLRETEPDEPGPGGIGLTLDLPVTFGIYNVGEIDDLLDLENFGTVSFTPGLMAEWAVTERWWLRGYGHLGWGIDTRRDEQAWIWDIGVRSRYAVGPPGQPVGLFTEVFNTGYRPVDGASNNLSGIGVGVDYRHPVSWRSNAGEPLDLVGDLSYRWFGDELTFNSFSAGGNIVGTNISDEWRFGIAVALRERQIKFWFVEFDQLGMAYRTSSDGQFKGLTVNITGRFRS